MALLKNLYLDLGYLNPFRKRSARQNETIENQMQPAAEEKKAVIVKEIPQVSKNIIISEHKKLELPKVERKKIEQPAKIELKEEMARKMPVVTNDTKKQQTYFSNITGKELIHKDALKEMQEFWQEKKFHSNGMQLSSHMNEEVSKKIDELQSLEIEWQKMQLEHEKLKDMLSSKEQHIENHIKDLKKKFKGMHFHANAPEHHAFILHNGTRLKSLNDLSGALQKMEDGVFFSHVNSSKNDFSQWIKDVMSLNDLADKIYPAKSRQEMVSLLHDWKESH